MAEFTINSKEAVAVYTSEAGFAPRRVLPYVGFWVSSWLS